MRKTEALQFEYDDQWQVLCEQAQKVQWDRPTKLDMQRLGERRSSMVSIRKMMETRRKAEEQRDLELLASSQAIQEKFPPELVAGMAWRDFVQDAWERAVGLRDRLE